MPLLSIKTLQICAEDWMAGGRRERMGSKEAKSALHDRKESSKAESSSQEVQKAGNSTAFLKACREAQNWNPRQTSLREKSDKLNDLQDNAQRLHAQARSLFVGESFFLSCL